MSKFRIKLKLQGLELEVEGTKDDLPLLTKSLAHQFEGLIRPAAEMAGGEDNLPIQSNATVINAAEAGKKKRKTKSGQVRSSTPGDAAGERAVDWKHDPSEFGSPLQTWSSVDKSIWTLYVAEQKANVKEMTGTRIAMTFNKHFRQAGPIKTGNVNRDLGKLKVAQDGKPPLVSEDTTQNPPVWFLVEAGINEAKKLVGVARGQAASTGV